MRPRRGVVCARPVWFARLAGIGHRGVSAAPPGRPLPAIVLELGERAWAGVPCWSGRAERWASFTVPIAYDLRYDTQIRPVLGDNQVSRTAVLAVAAARELRRTPQRATDGEHVVINIVGGMQKAKNIARDPRVAVNIVGPDDVNRFYAVRGRVVTMTSEGARQSIDEISQKYLGIPYPNFSGNTDETRLLITIEADSVASPMRD